MSTTSDAGSRAHRDHEPPMSIPEAARFLNVTERWVRRAVTERLLPYHKVGRHVRFQAADLRAYLASTRVEPARHNPPLTGSIRRLAPELSRRPGDPPTNGRGGQRPASA